MADWNNHKEYVKAKCKICSNKSFSSYGVFNNFTGIKCDECGLIQIKQEISDEVIDKFYSNNYYDNYYEGIGYEEAYRLYLKKDFQSKINLINNLSKNKDISILEVGGGLGYFSKMLKDNGFTNVALWEINDDSISYAKNLGVNVEKVNIFDTKQSKKFDLVISWATIEHVKEPQTFFDTLLKFVEPHGFLLIDTGLADTFRDKYSQGISGWFYPPEHLFVHTKKSLLIMSEACDNRKVVVNFKETRFNNIVSVLKFSIKRIIKKEKNRCYDIGILICQK